MRNYLKATPLLTRLVLTSISFVLPVVLGTILLFVLAQNSLQREMNRSLESGVVLLDRLLWNADAAAQRAYPYTQGQCDEVLPYIRDLVVIIPDVRMITLIKDGRIYCSSLLGKVDTPLPDYKLVDNSLVLMPSSPITPKESALSFVMTNGEISVASSISGYYLKNILTLTSQEKMIHLQIGETWIDKTGHVSTSPIKSTLRVNSKHYAYSLSVWLSGDDYVDFMVSHKQSAMIILIGFCAVMAWYTYWITGKPESMKDKINRAIYNKEFVPYVQPYVDSDYNIVGAEVLMRWNDPQEGLVRPDLFIPLAEESGLIIPMTKLIMAQVGEQLSLHQDLLGEGFTVSFNISAKHCINSDLLEDSLSFLNAFSPGKVRLCLELTERELIENTKEAQNLFTALHENNIQLAIDDFGTGHSSLRYLHQFRFDVLKIDQSFIRMIGNDSVSAHIVENLLDLASRLGMNTVAEGVETLEQVEYLAQHKVHCLQGYYFAKPMPIKEFIDSISKQS
ncbi:EAL domain-containing protein [Vibrio pectenicida]|uniref:cyclic-guanylate-specific phosphodiesterase n=1 Tax=Vibrio pectenicida TaxID=62763 RepID=A0A7Y4EFW7_9VIBR|nr:EAL domain-containing protein [Vibrio pectenicida]NOH73219.1 EAL domain-containing protein [Vibrio pectenicida]